MLHVHIFSSIYCHDQVDVDICGPSIPRIMGAEGERVHHSGSGYTPVVGGCDTRAGLCRCIRYMRLTACMQYVNDNLSLMSIGFLLPNPDEAVIWRGPKKNGVHVRHG